jgi:hypothetical protein
MMQSILNYEFEQDHTVTRINVLRIGMQGLLLRAVHFEVSDKWYHLVKWKLCDQLSPSVHNICRFLKPSPSSSKSLLSWAESVELVLFPVQRWGLALLIGPK